MSCTWSELPSGAAESMERNCWGEFVTMRSKQDDRPLGLQCVGKLTSCSNPKHLKAVSSH